jgi:hypothetical protein
VTVTRLVSSGVGGVSSFGRNRGCLLPTTRRRLRRLLGSAGGTSAAYCCTVVCLQHVLVTCCRSTITVLIQTNSALSFILSGHPTRGGRPPVAAVALPFVEKTK